MKEKQRITGEDIVQSRAIKTREKILKAAISAYAEKGYHHTTVDEIAKIAEVSVGAAYRYFKDKKELLLAALEYGFSHIAEYADVSETDLFEKNLERALGKFEKIHADYHDIHEELEGLRHTDEDVKSLYDEFTERALEYVFDTLPEAIKKRKNSFENLIIAVGIMENHCHYIMDKEPNKRLTRYMRKRTVELVKYVLSGD